MEDRFWFKLEATNYSDLENVLPRIIDYMFDKFWLETEEDTEHTKKKRDLHKNQKIEENLLSLYKNKKPCGVNYGAHPRLIFPIQEDNENIEFYLSFLEYVSTGEKRERSIYSTINDIESILKEEKLEFERLLSDRIEKLQKDMIIKDKERKRLRLIEQKDEEENNK